MPIYEYECSNCHQTFDLIQKISDKPVTQCPNCLQHSAIRLVSAAGFQLKGNGWDVTDFKNKPQDNKSHTQSKSEKKDNASAKNTTQTKPTSSNSTEK